MKKSIISVILSAVLMFSGIPNAAFADFKDNQSTSVKYSVTHQFTPDDAGKIYFKELTESETTSSSNTESNNSSDRQNESQNQDDSQKTEEGSSKFSAGTTVGCTIEANEDKAVDTSTINIQKKDARDESTINLENLKNDDDKTISFQFVMPEYDVVVNAGFKDYSPSIKDDKNQDSGTENKFSSLFDAQDNNFIEFSSTAAFTISAYKCWNKIEFLSGDETGWTEWESGQTINATKSSSSGVFTVRMRGEGNRNISGNGSTSYQWTIAAKADLSCTGNVETLLDHNVVASKGHPEMNEGCFLEWLADCTWLIKVPELHSQTLEKHCYDSMFAGCTKLKTAPDLNATVMAEYCYSAMFADCEALEVAPVLPAGSSGKSALADSCYSQMFTNCTSLAYAPDLPATELANDCYSSMFEGCTALEATPALPATKLRERCYNRMFAGCTKIIKPADFSEVSQVEVGSCSSMYLNCTTLAIYEEPTDIYTLAWKVPSQNEATNWSKDMFKGTAGKFQGSPSVRKNYYIFDEDPDLLTIESSSTFTVQCAPGWNGRIYYSYDSQNWKTWGGEIIQSKKAGFTPKQLIMFKGDDNTTITSNVAVSSDFAWIITGTNVTIEGNFDGLLNYDYVKSGYSVEMADDAFAYMFYNNNSIVSAPNMKRTILSKGCYQNMYQGCTSLALAPALAEPEEQLTENCYKEMFAGCTSLVKTCSLDAKKLANYCYCGMFKDCSSLVISPVLRSEALPEGCYKQMFMNCVGITAPSLLDNVYDVTTDSCAEMYKGCTELVFMKTPDPNWNDQWNAPSANFGGSWSKDMFAGDRTDCPTPLLGERYFIRNVYEEYLSFESDQQFYINVTHTWNGTMFYSTDSVNFSEITGATQDLYAKRGTNGKFTLFIRGKNNNIVTGENSTSWMPISKTKTLVYCYGNVFNLLDWETVQTSMTPPEMEAHCFYKLFEGATCLATSPLLPSFNLTTSCYESMFAGCTNMQTVPNLYAYKLATSCYKAMFKGCEKIKDFPITVKTYTAPNCFDSIFEGCNSLKIPDTIQTYDVSPYCFAGMFRNVNSIGVAPSFSITTLAEGCFEATFEGCSALTNPNMTYYPELKPKCFKEMYKDCTMLIIAPTLPYTTLADYCYEGMFKGCSRLSQTPTLSSTNLVQGCYKSMFEGCSTLRTCSTSLSATYLPSHCYDSMFKDCTHYLTAPIDISQVEVISDGSCESMYEGCENMAVNLRAAGYCDKPWIATSIQKTSASWAHNMFLRTSGELQSTPEIGKTYYVLSDSKNYVTFSSQKEFSINIKDNKRAWYGTMEYSTDTKNWSEWDGTAINAAKDSNGRYLLYFRGEGNNSVVTILHGWTTSWKINGEEVYCDGNIENLLNYKYVSRGREPILGEQTFYGMFEDNTCLMSSPSLPSQQLNIYSYANMFKGCTSLVSSPSLPAVELSEGCYSSMFEGCTSLTFPADISKVCQLGYNCCSQMYYECDNLRVNSEKDDTYCTEWIASSAKEGPSEWSKNMFSDTATLGNTLITSPEAGNTYYITKKEISNFVSFCSTEKLNITVGSSQWNGKLFYSYDRKTWTKVQGYKTFTTHRNVDGMDYIYFAGEDNTVLSGNTNSPFFTIKNNSGKPNVTCNGDLSSLLDHKKVENNEEITMGPYCFKKLFECNGSSTNSQILITTPTVSLQKLSAHCYDSMFKNCTKITDAPQLTSTQLAESCYENMFSGCTSLKNVGCLPATILAKTCYQNMFNGCSALTEAPELSADTTEESCCQYMFANSSITTAPNLYATKLATSCYAHMFENSSVKSLDVCQITEANNYCCSCMFKDCTQLESVPQDMIKCEKEEEEENIGANCFEYMFESCTALVKAPDVIVNQMGTYSCLCMFAGCCFFDPPTLSSENLEEGCYNYMFYYCKNLKEPPILPSRGVPVRAYSYMFYGCENLEVPAQCYHVEAFHEYGCESMYEGCTKIALYDDPGTHSATWKTPSGATTKYRWCYNMFKGTSGKIQEEEIYTDTYYYLNTTQINAYLYQDGYLIFSFEETSSEEHGKVVGNWSGFANKSFDEGDAPWSNYAENIKVIEIKDILTSTSFEYWFADLPNLTKFYGEKIMCSASYFVSGMFKNCPNLNEIDLSEFDLYNLGGTTDYMFGSCPKLQTISLGPRWNFKVEGGIDIPDRVPDLFYDENWKLIKCSNEKYVGKLYSSCNDMPIQVYSTYTWNERPKVTANYFNFEGGTKIYSGQEQEAKVSIKPDQVGRVGEIKKIRYKNLDTEEITDKVVDAGKYQVLISGDSGTVYHPYIDFTADDWILEIAPLDLNECSCTINGLAESYDYCGKFITPSVTVYSEKFKRDLIQEDEKEIIISYKNNYHASYSGGEQPCVCVDGNKNFTGQVIKEFVINKAVNIIADFETHDIQYGGTPDFHTTSKFGTVEYAYSIYETTEFKEWDPKNEPGTYYVKAYVQPDEFQDYDFVAVVKSFKVTGEEMQVNATPTVGLTYDGKEYALGVVEVSKPSTGYEISYKERPTEEYYTKQMIQKSDAGVYTVYYKVKASGYTPYEGSFTTSIAPKTVSVSKIKAIDRVYNGSVDVDCDVSGAEIQGIVSPTAEIVKVSSAVGKMENADACQSEEETKPVEVTEVALTGDNAHNYICDSAEGTTIHISKAVSTLMLRPETQTYYANVINFFTCVYVGDEKFEGQFEVSSSDNNVASSTFTWEDNKPVVNVTPKTAGNAEITVKLNEGKNYTGTQAVHAATVKNSTLHVQEVLPQQTLIFNNTDQCLGYVNVLDLPIGTTATTTYKIEGESETSTDPIYKKDAKEYTVNYHIECAGYDSVDGQFKTKIYQAGNKFEQFKCDDIYYQQNPAPQATPKFGEAKDIVFTYSDSAEGTFKEWDTANLPGTYYVKAFLKGNSNYTDAVNVLQFELIPLTIENVKVEKPEYLEYTGSEVALGQVTTTTPDCTIMYKIGDEPTTQFTEDEPTAVNANTYKIYYKVEKTGYYSVNNYFYSFINKAGNEFKVFTSEKIKYGEDPRVEVVPKFGTTEEVAVTYSSSQTGSFGPWDKTNPVGTYWVKAKISGTDNYYEYDQRISFEVENNDLKVETHLPKNLEYTGSEQNIGYITTTPDGCDIEYARYGKPYSHNLPSGTDVGYYLYYYKATKDNYNPVEDYFVNYIYKGKNEIINFECEDVAYGQAPQPVATAKFGEVLYLYSDKEDGIYKPWDTSNPAGQYYVKAYVEEGANYYYVEEIKPFNVNKADPKLVLAETATYKLGSTITLETEFNGESDLTVTCSNPDVVNASLEGTNVILQILEPNMNCDLTVSAPQSQNYNAVSKTQHITTATRDYCIVKFETNGGSVIDPVTVAGNTPVTKPDNPVYKGKRFDCWCVDSGLTTAYDFAQPVVKDMTLYAKYTVGDIDVPEDQDIDIDKSAIEEILQNVKADNPQAKTIVVSVDVKKWQPASTDKEVLDNNLKDAKYYAHQISLLVTIDKLEPKNIGDSNDVLIPITYTLDIKDKENVGTCRVHNAVFDRLTSNPNAEGEYSQIDATGQKVKVVAKKFSTYAFDYKGEPIVPDVPDTPSVSDLEAAFAAMTSDTAVGLLVCCSVVGVALLAGAISVRRKRSRKQVHMR